MTTHAVRLLLLTALLLAPRVASASGGDLQAAVERAIERTAPRVVQLRYFGAGEDTIGGAAAPVTGYLLDDAWVITSSYALGQEPAAIVCRSADGRQAQARIAGRDHNRRLVLLRLDGSGDADPPTVEGRPATVGETAIALGRVYTADEVNVAVGVVSAVGRLGGRAVQTDALASPANYGGPLVALDGSLLGVLSPLSPPGQSGVSLYDSGIGFAVPIAQLSPRLERLAGGDDLQPGRLGASFTKDDPLRAAPELLGVAEDGPAELAGLQAGDTIVALAGKPTPTLWSLRAAASGLDAGQAVEVTFRRGHDAQPTSVQLVLGEPIAEPADDEDGSPVDAIQIEKPDGP